MRTTGGFLLRARGEVTIFSQSRDGPAERIFEVTISTVSPDLRCVSSGDEAAVHSGTHAAVTDLGVDGVGEVDRCRTGRSVMISPFGVKT